MKELGRAVGRNSTLLAGFAVLTALLVAGTFLEDFDFPGIMWSFRIFRA